jgi:hypothetical protein
MLFEDRAGVKDESGCTGLNIENDTVEGNPSNVWITLLKCSLDISLLTHYNGVLETKQHDVC